MKKKISLAVIVLFMIFINLTISIQYTSNNNQISISFLESRADGNSEVSDPDPGEYPVPDSKTPEEWSLSSILETLFNL